MKCRYCGETIKGDEKFCPSCGRRLVSEHLSEEKNRNISESVWFKHPNDSDLSGADDANLWTDNRINESTKIDREKEERAVAEDSADPSYKDRSLADKVTNRIGNLDRTRIMTILQGIEKKYIAIAAAVVAVCIIILCYILIPHTVNEPCDHCNRRPSVAFDTSDGSKAYVCLECMKTCMHCGRRRPTHHYENMLGTIIFVCDDCYKEVIGD